MKVFLISLVIPGNPYPVTEIPFTEDETGKILEYNPDGFYGKACQPGYQSHFTLSLDLSFHCSTSNKQQTTNKTSKLVGPRDKKNQENTGPFPIQGTFDAQRDADELVVFESAQAVPLFIVYTDPAIPVVKVEEKKSSLHASFLSTLKPAEKETGLLFCFFSFDSLYVKIIHFTESINAGDDSIRKENESLKQQLISKGDELARKEQEKQEAIKQKEQEKQEAIQEATRQKEIEKDAEMEELKALLLEMRKKLEKKK